MFKAVCSAGTPDLPNAGPVMHLTFPVSFEQAGPHPAEAGQPPQHYADAMAEMMSWSPWNADTRQSRARGNPAWTEAGPIIRDGAGGWQVRLDMTLADAEDLAEGLRAVITAAKARLYGQAPRQSLAITLPGLQIDADPVTAPRSAPALNRVPAHTAG